MFNIRIIVMLLLVSSLGFGANMGRTFKMSDPKRVDLQNKKVIVAPGVSMEVGNFVIKTNLKAQPNFKTYFDKSFEREFLKKPAVYTETVESKDDKLVVTRTLIIEPKNPCDARMTRVKGAMSMCFKKSNKVVPANIKNQFRDELIKVRDKAQQDNSMSAKEKNKIASMSDEELINYILNETPEEKIIVHESILPLVVYKKLTPQPLNLMQPNIVMPTANQFTSNISTSSTNDLNVIGVSKVNTSKVQGNIGQNPNSLQLNNAKKQVAQKGAMTQQNSFEAFKASQSMKDDLIFETSNEQEYKLLLGETYGKHYGDYYRIRFAKERWWHDEYYAKFSYTLGYGAGLRWPFMVKVKSNITKVENQFYNNVAYPQKYLCKSVTDESKAKECAVEADVEISAYGIDADAAFYRSVGVPNNKIFEGKEFVFELQANARLYISIPGPNLNYHAPGVDLEFGSNYKSPLGNQNSRIVDFMLKGHDIGLEIGAYIGYAALDVGAFISAEEGELKVDFVGDKAENVPVFIKFNEANVAKKIQVTENVGRGSSKKAWGVLLNNPQYKTKFKITPQIALSIGVDVLAYEWSKTFGPIPLTAMSINLGTYHFKQHSGTLPQPWEYLKYTIAHRTKGSN